LTSDFLPAIAESVPDACVSEAACFCGGCAGF